MINYNSVKAYYFLIIREIVVNKNMLIFGSYVRNKLNILVYILKVNIYNQVTEHDLQYIV